MLHNFRRHRLRLGRSLAGLMVLVWMTVALQPCAAAQPVTPPPTPVMAHHHDHHGMTVDAMQQDTARQQQVPCPPGADCPVFKAVDSQVASKAADTLDLPAPLPALVSSWPLPLFVAPTPVQSRVVAVALPAPPILEFRVLLI